jgi:hypothetical protein
MVGKYDNKISAKTINIVIRELLYFQILKCDAAGWPWFSVFPTCKDNFYKL